ncbi:MAG: type II secretion system minor pseudopilin GspK [Cocleimonas sp.]|nr:type II secretion system minor pseudopilin GspK [Cocleimonas sp.]
MKSQQRGVALIIALVITTVAVSMASLAMYRQQLQIRLSGNLANLEQTYQFAIGMEDWSKKILEQDYKDNPNVDHEKEDWATNAVTVPIDGGNLSGQLLGLQKRLNLNILNAIYPKVKPPPKVEGQDPAKTPNQPVYKTEELVYNYMVNLIKKIDTEQVLGSPESFADTLSDWIDKDDDVKSGGAESSYYQSQNVPYMTANASINHTSELLLLKGMDKKLFKKLEPFVASLPSDAKINVNTAEKEVLAAIGFDSTTVEAIWNARNANPFENMDAFWNVDAVNTFFAPNTIAAKRKANYEQTLTTTTNYFLLQGKVNINNARLYINTVFKREKGKVHIIMRDYGKPPAPVSRSDQSEESNTP